MFNHSPSAVIFIIAVLMFSLFSSVSVAFSSTALPASDNSAPGAFGFTPTPTRVPDVSTQSRSGGGPPGIPEPTTVILTGLGLAGLAGYAARKKRNGSDDPPQE